MVEIDREYVVRGSDDGKAALLAPVRGAPAGSSGTTSGVAPEWDAGGRPVRSGTGAGQQPLRGRRLPRRGRDRRGAQRRLFLRARTESRLPTIAPPCTLGKCHSEKSRVLCDGLDGRGTLLAEQHPARRQLRSSKKYSIGLGLAPQGCRGCRSCRLRERPETFSWRWSVSEPRSAPTVGQVVLGRRLLDLRESAGLKREEAARVLRVAPATVRRMEMAEVALKIPYLQLLLKAYGVSDSEADAFVSWRRTPTGPAGGSASTRSCPAGSRCTSVSRARLRSSAATSPTSSPVCCRPRTTHVACCSRVPSGRPGPRTSRDTSPCACNGRICSPVTTQPGCGS
ncbi:hypothetical protein SHIRM173S_07045 [Streptomyces hirsutus]